MDRLAQTDTLAIIAFGALVVAQLVIGAPVDGTAKEWMLWGICTGAPLLFAASALLGSRMRPAPSGVNHIGATARLGHGRCP